MLRSLYSGIAGMRGFQEKLDVIGNNIANVNTTGFKAGRVMFKDIMSQTIQGAGAPDPNGNFGGTNPKQIGLGSTISSIDTLMTDGSDQTTNRNLDFAIQGNGFFTVSNGTNTYYTRAGNFYFDSNGDLVNSDGYKVLDNAGAPINVPNMNTVKSISFDSNGVGTYIDATGASQTLNPIGLQTFSNPDGLEKAGDSLYQDSPNAGKLDTVSSANTNGAGSLMVGALEMSNVDLTNEFSEMIVAQRGFQANAKTITTADNILQTIVNMIQ